MKKILFVFIALFVSTLAVSAQPTLKSVDELTEFKLTYELNGGINDASNKDKYTENSVVKLGSPTKRGYVFRGWYWDKDFKSVVKDSTFSGKHKDLKVYAMWNYSEASLKTYESNMVTIIPEGKKVELDDFAGNEGKLIINAYSISKYEVTKGLYEVVMSNDNSSSTSSEYPVLWISWYDAIEFCNRFSKKCGLEPVYIIDGHKVEQDLSKNGYRLPTRAEWEMAARGGLEGGWDYLYSGSNNIDEVAWWSGNSGTNIHPVAQKKANSCGLYDMSGNAEEWVWDSVAGDGSNRYICGGSYGDGNFGISYSHGSLANFQNGYKGFRVACSAAKKEKSIDSVEMIDIPGKKIKMQNTEVTQKLYESIIGSNPSYFKGNNNPVEKVSWYDAIYFCNKLSEKYGFVPVYSVEGKTSPDSWDYKPHKAEILNEVTQNLSANGFRLPTIEEWKYANKGGQKYIYSGSDNLDEVGWYKDNSVDKTHSVAQKKSNGYGLYDMSGNVWEWCWDVNSSSSNERLIRGGSYNSSKESKSSKYDASNKSRSIGFRVVRNVE